MEKIKNKSFFKWPNKMTGNPTKRNQNLYCHYHQEQGHTTEDYRNLWDHLDHLDHHSSGQGNQTNSNSRKKAPSRPPLGTINVIFAALGRTGSCPSRVMSVTRLSINKGSSEPKRAKILTQSILGFSVKDKAKTIQPHDDA